MNEAPQYGRNPLVVYELPVIRSIGEGVGEKSDACAAFYLPHATWP